MQSTHQFRVAMPCNGCANAVQRALGRLDGVSNVTISLEKQLVTVSGQVSMSDALACIQKTGKEVSPLTEIQ